MFCVFLHQLSGHALPPSVDPRVSPTPYTAPTIVRRRPHVRLASPPSAPAPGPAARSMLSLPACAPGPPPPLPARTLVSPRNQRAREHARSPLPSSSLPLPLPTSLRHAPPPTLPERCPLSRTVTRGCGPTADASDEPRSSLMASRPPPDEGGWSGAPSDEAQLAPAHRGGEERLPLLGDLGGVDHQRLQRGARLACGTRARCAAAALSAVRAVHGMHVCTPGSVGTVRVRGSAPRSRVRVRARVRVGVRVRVSGSAPRSRRRSTRRRGR